MNLLCLKKSFDLNKGKTIYLNKRFYIDIYMDYNTTVSIYDNQIPSCYKAISQISYNVNEKTILLFLSEDGILTSKNKMEYNLTDSIDNLKLSPELIKELKKYYTRRILWKIKSEINLVLKKDKI